MISAEELNEYIRTLQAAGITGRAKIGDIEITIPTLATKRDEGAPARSQKADYDRMLYAATEGIPDDEDRP